MAENGAELAPDEGRIHHPANMPRGDLIAHQTDKTVQVALFRQTQKQTFSF